VSAKPLSEGSATTPTRTPGQGGAKGTKRRKDLRGKEMLNSELQKLCFWDVVGGEMVRVVVKILAKSDGGIAVFVG
jgi:hypothetical protein